MASLIEGFSYDIFISYRQKDNKYDGWVTEFVDNLKKELEATFKEDVSVYFDINPHDGLLETHDVDASLKNKLKCLVFIPIISHTYCDPKSFAWEHEFKAFIEQASKDQYGLKIELPGGNVANRVLPVQIHDLDADDKEMFESELGGFLRGIEFIYKEPGVNRPLMANEDHPDNNLNKTFYRNQINKIANAIKEIITGLKNQDREGKEIFEGIDKEKPSDRENQKIKIVVGSLILLVLIVTGYYIVPKLVNSSEHLEKSIAILPFELLSDEPDKQYLADGMMIAITLNLSKIKDLRVISRTSIEQYRGTTKTARQIGKELDAKYLLEGSFQKFGDNSKLIVQLIKAYEESHAWGNEYNSTWSEVFSLQSEVAQSIARELNAVITPEEKQLIEKRPTTIIAAYDAYLKGYYYMFGQKSNHMNADSAMKYFELAKEIDPRYALAFSGISNVWRYRYSWGTVSLAEGYIKAVESINKAIELDSASAEVQNSLGSLLAELWDWDKSELAFKKAIELNPNLAEAHAFYSILLNNLGRNEEAIKHAKIALKLDPGNPWVINSYALDLFYVRQYNDALKTIDNVLKVDSAFSPTLWIRPYVFHMAGRYEEALEAFKIFYSKYYLKEYDHAFDKGFSKGGYKSALRMEADTLLAQENLIKTQHFIISDLATLYILSGNKEKGLTLLEMAFRERDPIMTYLLMPIFDTIRDDSRFQDLCRRMNLPYK